MVSAQVRREQARLAKSRGLSLRRACALVGVARSALGYVSQRASRDAPVRARMRQLSRKHPRWGHRFIGTLLAREGHAMSFARALRLWRAEGLCLPRRRPRRRRRGASDPMRHIATKPNEIWAIDFVFDRCNAGTLKCLTVIDEHTRRCLALDVDRSLRGRRVTEVLAGLVHKHGGPRVVRSDNGPEFISKVLFDFALGAGIEKAFIEPGNPWQNGKNESFNGKFRNECLSVEWFRSLAEARVVIEAWRREYNGVRPHSSLDYLTPNEYTARIRQQATAQNASIFT